MSAEKVTCSSCGHQMPAGRNTCDACQKPLNLPFDSFGSANLSVEDFDDLLATESSAQPLNLQQSAQAKSKLQDEKTEALLRSYGAGKEELKQYLTPSAAKQIDSGLRLHFIATIGFTLFLLFSAIGVGCFFSVSVIESYIKESEAISKSLNTPDDIRQGQDRRREFLRKVAAILGVIALISFFLGILPVLATIVVDFVSLTCCLHFPKEKGARSLQIVAAVFRGVSAFALIGGIGIALALGASLSMSLLIGLASALPPLVGAWACFCGSLGQLGAYFDREDLTIQSHQLLAMGLITIVILTGVPIITLLLVTSGQGILLIGIAITVFGICWALFRQDPVSYVTNFALYLSSLKFSLSYANFLQGLRHVVKRSPKLPEPQAG